MHEDINTHSVSKLGVYRECVPNSTHGDFAARLSMNTDNGMVPSEVPSASWSSPG